MPKMPFPSYSVFHLADANATYGSQDGVRRVADAAHALGMKVIVDMVFHGPLEYDPALGLPRSPLSGRVPELVPAPRKRSIRPNLHALF